MTAMTNQSDILSAAFIALADTTRRAIFECLAQAPSSVGTLAQRMPVTRSAVSQHLQVLHKAGLIEQTRSGQQRIYALRRESEGVLGKLSEYARSFLEPIADAPDERVQPPPANEHCETAPMNWVAVNDEVDTQVVALAGRFYVAGHRMEQLLARTAARHGLNVGEAMILGTLKRLGGERACTPTQLGQHSLISLPGIAKRLSRLEQMGLVERTTAEQDRRSVQVALTAAGTQVFEAISHEQFTRNYSGFIALSAVQREGLDEALSCLLVTLPQT